MSMKLAAVVMYLLVAAGFGILIAPAWMIRAYPVMLLLFAAEIATAARARLIFNSWLRDH